MNGFEKKITWCFWFGKEFSKNRESCFRNLKETQSNVVLVTEDNLNQFVLDDYPIHSHFRFLSSTHKSDYLRSYFMNLYGGAYSDIKKQDANWDAVFESISKEGFIGAGYREICPSHLAKSITKLEQRIDYASFVGCGAFIYKSHSPFTEKWFKKTQDKMDSIANLLEISPGDYHPRATIRGALQSNEEPRGYPLDWTCLMGDIYHPIVYEFRKKIKKDLPKPIMTGYR